MSRCGGGGSRRAPAKLHRSRVAYTTMLQFAVLVCLAGISPGTTGAWGRSQQDQLTPAGLGEYTIVDAKMSCLGREGPPRGLVGNEIGVEELVQALVRPAGSVNPDAGEKLA